MVEQCLRHTPTLEEAYSVKARVLKHAGDPTGAAASADKARHMDLADRHGSLMLTLDVRQRSCHYEADILCWPYAVTCCILQPLATHQPHFRTFCSSSGSSPCLGTVLTCPHAIRVVPPI